MQHIIGFVDEQACDSATVRQQIDQAREWTLAIQGPDGEEVNWLDIDNPDEPRTILRFIQGDREIRIDQKTLMADRPPFAVLTVADSQIVRLEFYEGHDALELAYDLRAPQLKGLLLERYLSHDPQAYDPSEYLQQLLGLTEEERAAVTAMLHEAHKPKGD